jgi:hypothetical protein
MQKLHEQIKVQLQKSNQRYKDRIDQKMKKVNCEVGDQVLEHLSKEIFSLGKYNKMKLKNIWPCKILKKVVANAYEIYLLEGNGISLIFNIVDLYPFRMDGIG